MLVTKLMLSAEEEIGPDNVPCLRNVDAIWLVTSPVLWLLANSILLIIFGGKTIVEGSNLAYVFGPCWARKWVVLIFKGSFRPKISFWSSLTSEVAKGNQIYPFYYDGVKLSTMSNCPVCCDGVKLSAVSNCLQWQIVLGVKLSYLPSWCKIVLGVKLSYHRILELNFGQDSEAEVRSEILKLNLVKSSKLKFGQDFEADVWLSFWGLSMVKIMKLNSEKNLQYDDHGWLRWAMNTSHTLHWKLREGFLCFLWDLCVFWYLISTYLPGPTPGH